MGVSKKLLTPSVVEAVVKKVNQKRITNSKDLRKLRSVLPDPVARAQFLSDQGDIDSAVLRVGPTPRKRKTGLSGELDVVLEAMKNVPWTALQELKGDAEVLNKIAEAEALLRSLRKALSLLGRQHGNRRQHG
jgi:ParB family chromosome partitioning protein